VVGRGVVWWLARTNTYAFGRASQCLPRWSRSGIAPLSPGARGGKKNTALKDRGPSICRRSNPKTIGKKTQAEEGSEEKLLSAHRAPSSPLPSSSASPALAK